MLTKNNNYTQITLKFVHSVCKFSLDTKDPEKKKRNLNKQAQTFTLWIEAFYNTVFYVGLLKPF